MPKLTRLAVVIVALGLVAGLGCERSPEDVEQWRNAKGGMEKMQEWATSPSEPMPVRIRAVEVIIEEHSPTTLDPTFESIDDEEAQKEIVEAVTSRIQKMWETQDTPELDEETKQEGGKVDVSKESEAVKAKDAAYYLVPYASGENKSTLQSILDEWLSQDWELRDQLGKTDLDQSLSRSTDQGAKHLLEWLKKTDDPHQVAETLRENAEIDEQVAEILIERARENHPELSTSLLSAIVNSESDKVLPYLKDATRDPDSSPKLIDQAMEAIKSIQGPRSVNFFSELISEHKGDLRWAAVNDLISIRGKGGILTAATALPLDKESYAHPEDDSFKKDSEWFANFVAGEMKDADVSTIAPTLVRALESERWPVQVLGLQTARAAHDKELLGDGADKVGEAVQALTSSRTEIPGWGETKRVGQLAHETADSLEK